MAKRENKAATKRIPRKAAKTPPGKPGALTKPTSKSSAPPPKPKKPGKSRKTTRR